MLSRREYVSISVRQCRKMSGATVGMLGYGAGADARQSPGQLPPRAAKHPKFRP